MDKGDRVKLKFHPHDIKGTIIDVETDYIWGADVIISYKVKYDDPQLIPPTDWHKPHSLECIELNHGSNSFVKCECGSDSIGGAGHSSWCPKN